MISHDSAWSVLGSRAKKCKHQRQGTWFLLIRRIVMPAEVCCEFFWWILIWDSKYHSPRIFYKFIPLRFFFVIFCIFTGIRCGVDIAQNQTRVARFWINAGKYFFVIFTKLIPRRIFLYCKNFGVDGILSANRLFAPSSNRFTEISCNLSIVLGNQFALGSEDPNQSSGDILAWALSLRTSLWWNERGRLFHLLTKH